LLLQDGDEIGRVDDVDTDCREAQRADGEVMLLSVDELVSSRFTMPE
jgi:hypothetical protein